jgi:hypothetical protein
MDLAGIRLDQPQQQPRESRFPAAAFADHGKSFALGHSKADPIHGSESWPVRTNGENAAPSTIAFPEFTCFEQGLFGCFQILCHGAEHESLQVRGQIYCPIFKSTNGFLRSSSTSPRTCRKNISAMLLGRLKIPVWVSRNSENLETI